MCMFMTCAFCFYLFWILKWIQDFYSAYPALPREEC
jgi:hypothetical protein